jgi:Tetratricopeptide repeat
MRAARAELLVVFAFCALLAATPPAAASQPSVAPAAASQPSVAPASSVVELLDQLSGAPDDAVATRVAAIEAAGGLTAAAEATAPADLAMLPDALFTAARACEERLHDPARALAIYERILARFPDARVAVAAGRRAGHLRAQIGQAGASVGESRAFSQLTFDGDRLPLDEVLRRADELAARSWPGAAEVLLWSAELVRRRGELPEAMRRYRAVIDRFGGGAAATLATRGLAGAAVERGDWALAEQMARALPVEDPADTVTRDELLAKARIGRATSRWFWLARVVLVVSVLGLGLSLLQLAGWRVGAALRVVIRPPVEVAYMAPAAALMIGASFTGNVAITPAVVVISAGGMLLAWLSGATLSEAQRRQRDSRRRSLLHLGTCVLAALSLAYLAIVHTGLLELLISTVQLGPER